MRCFVTGVAGFVGSYLAERLLADGHEVCGIDSFADNYDRSFKEQNLEGPRSWNTFYFIEGDLVEVALQPLLEGVDWIFHQAGQDKGQTNWASAFTHYTESNVLITLRLLEASLRFGWVRRFVYASSSSVYGKAAHLPIHEDELERPRSLHGVTKLAAESLCSLYHRRFGLPTVSLRYFSIYGPRQRPDMAFHQFCEAIVCRRPLYLYGGGYQTRDFIYIDDAVEATLRAATVEGAIGQVMNIASGTSVTLRSIVEQLEEISKARINVVVDDGQRDDIRHICADIQRAQQLLDYHPCMNLQDGLTREFEFIHRQYKHWPGSNVHRVVHHSGSDDIATPSDDYTDTRKSKPVNPTPLLKPQTSQANNLLAESIGDTALRKEAQMGASATWQELQMPEISSDMPSDKQHERAKLLSLANETTISSTATPTLQVSPDNYAAEPTANVEQPGDVVKDDGAASKNTAPKLIAVLEPEIKQADSQEALQTPQISQTDINTAESIANVEQPGDVVKDDGAASKNTAPKLIAVLEPEIRQADSQEVLQTPQISQTDTNTAEPTAAQQTGPQVDTQANARQNPQAARQSRVNVSSNKQRHLASPSTTGESQTFTGSGIHSSTNLHSEESSSSGPASRVRNAAIASMDANRYHTITRPAPNQTEQNHMRVAIIALLLVGLLLLGACLAVYAQFAGRLPAIIGPAGAASAASITIKANATDTLENIFTLIAVTGNPNTAQHQIKARQVSATTQPVSETIQTTNASNSASSSGSDSGQTDGSDQNTTAQPIVQQSDIDAAVNNLETANAPSAASILQPQLAHNELLVGNSQCQPQVSADQKAGNVANSVTVTVVFSCTGEAYDQDAAEKMAAQELTEQAKKDLGGLYTLSGQITTTVKDASISDANQGTIAIVIDARGTWTFQLHKGQQQVWANSLVGKSQLNAYSFLLRQKGIKQANIQLTGGDGHTLPTDAKEITLKVQPIASS